MSLPQRENARTTKTLSYEESNEKVIIIVKMKNGYYRFEEKVMDKKE